MIKTHFRLFADQRGASIIVFAVVFPMLLIAAGVAIDLGRYYAVNFRAQDALDAATLGATSTKLSSKASGINFDDDLKAIFAANFPVAKAATSGEPGVPGYMGTTSPEFTINQSAINVYNAEVTMKMPTTIMALWGHRDMTIHVESQVAYGINPDTLNEIALVLDTTYSMKTDNKMQALKDATSQLLDIIFQGKTDLPGVYFSVIPYSNGVNVGSGHAAWIKPNFIDRYNDRNLQFLSATATELPIITGLRYTTPSYYEFYNYSFFYMPTSVLANRNEDLPCKYDPCTDHPFEYSPSPPNGDPESQFRTPIGMRVNVDPAVDIVPDKAPYGVAGQPGFYEKYLLESNRDQTDGKIFTDPNFKYRSDMPSQIWFDNVYAATDDSAYIAPLLFASSNRGDIQNAVNAMQPTGYTRINIGLMWGWYTLSSAWQGPDGFGNANLPLTPDLNVYKYMIMMTDGRNTIFNGSAGGSAPIADDDASTTQLCTNIRNAGIKLYVIGFGTGSDINTPLLQACASDDSYFPAEDAGELEQAFSTIGDRIIQRSIRLIK